MPALKLSRKTKIPRTSIYRNLEELVEIGVVREVEGPYGFLFEAEGITAFKKLVSTEQDRVAGLRDTLVDLEDQLNAQIPAEGLIPKVTVYKGESGLQQMLWNTLDAKEVCIFETGEMNRFVSDRFAERIRREFVVRGIKMKVLTNEREIQDFTKEEEFVRSHWEIRSINPNHFVFESELLIFEDKVAHFDFGGGSNHAIEVRDPKLVKYQLGLFNSLWVQGEEMFRFSPNGRSKVIEKVQI